MAGRDEIEGTSGLRGRAVAAACAALLAATVFFAMKAFGEPRKGGTRIDPWYKDGQVLVKFKAPRIASYHAQANALLASLGDRLAVSLTPLKTDKSIYVIQGRAGVDTAALLSRAAAEPSVLYAEPNYVYHLTEAEIVPNDPDFKLEWSFFNQGQKDSAGQLGSTGADISATKAWAQGTGSKDILVAVIDTGVDYTHPDLKNNIYVNPGESPGSGQDNDHNGFAGDWHGWNFSGKNNDPMDDNKHGTHVSGTIGAEGGNGIGVAGVSWHVSILPIKFLSSSGTGTLDDAVDSINYATLMGAKIISASWGGGGFSQAMLDSIRKARDKGVLFIAAAGNDGNDNDKTAFYPASYDSENMIAVAATDNRDARANFSNYGLKTVNLAAPGVNIYSTIPTALGSYATLSGTSMATPHVSGAAALLWSLNRNMTYADIKKRLLTTVDPIHALSRKTTSGGRLNVYNALNNIVPPRHEPNASDWKGVTAAVESPHPYDINASLTFQVSHPGAKFIRVHFSRVSTEASYDFVRFSDAKGTVVEQLSGELTDYTSDYIEGDTATVTFSSDNSNNGWGFAIDRYDFVD